MKLWGGRFKGVADADFAQFNASFAFDRRLIEADIDGSLAQAEAICQAGILTEDEAQKIGDGLRTILQRVQADASYLDSRDAADVHSFVEAELAGLVGEGGYKLHSG